MKSIKSIAVVAAFLLVLTGVWFMPSVSGQGSEKSLIQRVAVLEEQVAELSAKVDDLESGSCSCSILNLEPLPKIPDNPSEGDTCVVLDDCNGEAFYNLVCYLDGRWVGLLSCNPIIR